jgi:hypothetical protein
MSDTALATRSEQPSSLQLANRGFVQLTSLQEARDFAEMLAKSDLVPKDYRGKPGDIVIAMQYGLELGVPPLQALQNITVINGRTSVWGDLVPAIVLAQPDCEDFKEDKPQGEDPDKWVATCTIIRRGKSPFVQTFSWADAKRAGLAGKSGPWAQYPKRQLQMRARGFCARDAYPDRFKGLITSEEAFDYPEPPQTPSEPRRVGESATPAAQQPSNPPAAAAALSPGAAASAAAAAAPAPSPQPDKVAAPAAAVAPAAETIGGVKVLDTKLVVTKSGSKLYEITTSQGVFFTQDETLYKSAASCEGADQAFTITWKWGRTDANRVKVAVAMGLDESGQAPATEPAKEGDEQPGLELQS